MIYLAIILLLLSGVAEGVKDKISFHYYNSIFTKFNPKFWNPEISWKNKYEKKFWGSTTIFVFLTDAWHLMKTIERWSAMIGIILLLICFNLQILLSLLVAFTIRSVAFNLTFKYTNKNEQ